MLINTKGTDGHADYPHLPGTLHGCYACEIECHCGDQEEPCVYCADSGFFEVESE